ncbi:MAG: hypothetical protein F6K22_10005 [Okeania sp. SIO2F4]|uniref:hypothetical protein n=1 Tax=Okeania sp. SIO2F4 TaxID=2607790 RepID=UPI00142BAD75|nr:hypothetical protein [Okeania sp. SIO2F4]NES03156.1 hypothetical protein [Okeania sp. SIO2F4]
MSVISTILYWAIELYVRYDFNANFIPSLNTPLVDPIEKLKLQTAIWIYRFIASILFIIVATIALFVVTVVLSIIDKPDNFMDVIRFLVKFLVVAVALGISLRFVSGFTTDWVKHFTDSQDTSLKPVIHLIGSTGPTHLKWCIRWGG